MFEEDPSWHALHMLDPVSVEEENQSTPMKIINTFLQKEYKVQGPPTLNGIQQFRVQSAKFFIFELQISLNTPGLNRPDELLYFPSPHKEQTDDPEQVQ